MKIKKYKKHNNKLDTDLLNSCTVCNKDNCNKHMNAKAVKKSEENNRNTTIVNSENNNYKSVVSNTKNVM